MKRNYDSTVDSSIHSSDLIDIDKFIERTGYVDEDGNGDFDIELEISANFVRGYKATLWEPGVPSHWEDITITYNNIDITDLIEQRSIDHMEKYDLYIPSKEDLY